MSGLIERTRERVRALWRAAKNERASPKEVGFAVAVGVFAGCTPAVMFHGWVAVGVATLLRLNRLYAFLGSRVSAFFIFPFIVLAEIQSSHFLRTRTWLALTWKNAVEEGATLLGDWLLGTILVGTPLAVLFGFSAYWLARRREIRRAAAAAESPES